MHIALVAIVATIVGVPTALIFWMQSPYVTRVGNPAAQPVMFDHRHHVNDDGIDCRYCHNTVETQETAGMPSTGLCMNCHSQIWIDSPLLEPVRSSFFSGRPIAWRRVNRVPDHVQFNHAIHVSKGVGCVTCHGRIDQMALVAKAEPLSMGWCLGCHREPERALRPREAVTDMNWVPPGDQRTLGAALAKQYGVRSLQHCSTCHR